MNFRPMYSSENAIDTNIVRAGGNMGLYFEKFPDAWQWKNGFPSFDPPPDQDVTGHKIWLDKVASGAVGNRDLISEATGRLFEFVQHRGGMVLCFVNESRFVSGTGLQHPTENGFAWHRTLGVPYLPGTSLKGTLSSFVDESTGGKPTESQIRMVGKCENVGLIGFTDLLPLAPAKLVVEVMTPHYGPYYSGGALPGGPLPGDWLNPVPITYLAVEKQQKWICGLYPTKGKGNALQHLLAEAKQLLISALIEIGAGAKTEVGFGRFAIDNATLGDMHKRYEAQISKQADELAKAEAMKGASEQLVNLMQRYESENWGKDIGWTKQNLVKYLQELETANTRLDDDSIAWIRKTVIEVGRNVGAWESPRATQGRQNEPKYSKTIVEIVETLKSFNQRLQSRQ